MNPKTKKWLTWIVVGFAGLMLAGGALAQVAGVPKVSADMTRVGVGDYYRAIGAFKLIFVALFLYPKTFRIGFLLLSCTLSGAMATLLSHGESPFAAAIPLTVLWIATYIRDRSVFLSLNSSPYSSPG